MSIINGIALESDKSIHVVSVSLVIFENFAIIVKKNYNTRSSNITIIIFGWSY